MVAQWLGVCSSTCETRHVLALDSLHQLSFLTQSNALEDKPNGSSRQQRRDDQTTHADGAERGRTTVLVNCEVLNLCRAAW